MKIIFMWMFGQFPKINSWLNWQSIDTRGQFEGEVNEIQIPCASSNYSQINFRMGKHGVKKPSISSDRRTNTGRSSRNVSTKIFLFFPSFRSPCTQHPNSKKKNRYYKKAPLYTHTTNWRHFPFFLGLNFSLPTKQKSVNSAAGKISSSYFTFFFH